MIRITHLLTALPCLIILTGCIGGSSPTVRYYVLNPAVTSSANDTSSLHVEVQAIRLPQYLERPQIVTRSNNQQIRLSETSQWGGNLRKNMSRTLSVNLSRALNTPNISVAPHRGSIQPDYKVEVEILKFERDADSKVRLSAQWRLSHFKADSGVTIKITELESQPINDIDDYDATVSTMADLFAQLSQTIASEIKAQQAG